MTDNVSAGGGDNGDDECEGDIMTVMIVTYVSET